MSADEIMALNLGRSCRIAAIAREMDTLWGLFLIRPSRLNSNDYLWMREIESLAKLILEMDRDQQSALDAKGFTSSTPETAPDTISVSSAPVRLGTPLLQGQQTVILHTTTAGTSTR